jgi:hypothetical protein
MISQLYILSLSGEVLLLRNFRQELPETSNEQFFSHYQNNETKDPILVIDGILYIVLKY